MKQNEKTIEELLLFGSKLFQSDFAQWNLNGYFFLSFHLRKFDIYFPGFINFKCPCKKQCFWKTYKFLFENRKQALFGNKNERTQFVLNVQKQKQLK